MAARRRSDDIKGTALGRALTAARDAAGLLQVPVAAQVPNMTQARLSRIERGTAIPKPADVAHLLDLYGVQGEERRRIEAMVAAQPEVKDQRLVVQRGRTAAMQARWARMSDESRLIRAYHPAIVIGSLQVPAYAGVVLDLDEAAMTERAAQAADPLSRQQRHVLIQTEGSLRATVGSVDVMREQVAHLIAVTRIPNVRLGVIPAYRPLPFTCGTAFHLYEGDKFAYAVVGLEVAAATLDQPEDIAHFTALFNRLAQTAVYDDEARAVLAEIAESYR